MMTRPWSSDDECVLQAVAHVWLALEEALRNGEGVEYDELLDLLEHAGLLRQEPYDPETHGPATDRQEPGDPWYVTTELAQNLAVRGAALRGGRAADECDRA